MRISLVVAAARNGVIGHRGGIPWRLPDDQRFFRSLTVKNNADFFYDESCGFAANASLVK